MPARNSGGKTLPILAPILILVALTWPTTLQANCNTCVQYGSAQVWGTPSVNGLAETSGIAASARNPGVVWVHNDGVRERIVALGTNAAHLASFNLNRTVEDVEDSAVGPGPAAGISYLYLGDIGGRASIDGLRDRIQILRIPEPLVRLSWEGDPVTATFAGVETFTLAYPDGRYDAETLLVDPWTADVLVVTKQNNIARIYRANLNGMEDGDEAALELLRSVTFDQASGGDIAADGSRIVLRQEDQAAMWYRCPGESIAQALGRAGQGVPVIGRPTEPNGEAIAFLRDGTGYLTTSEGELQPLLCFPSTCPSPPAFTLLPTNQSAYVGAALELAALAVGYPAPTYQWYHDGELLLGKTNPVLTLPSLSLEDDGLYALMATNPNGSATATATITVHAKPDVRITEVMSNPSSATPVNTSDWWELTNFESQPVDMSGWRFNDADGGLTDPYVFVSGPVLAPGESVVFVEGLSPTQFRNWWGAANVPSSVQIRTYTGTGLGFGAGGDSLRVWDGFASVPSDVTAAVLFGSATAGVTFNYDPITQQFGALSQLGVNGVFQASAGFDRGSPGRYLAPAAPPTLTVLLEPESLSISLDGAVGRRYLLESRTSLSSGSWLPTGDVILATNNMTLTFHQPLALPHVFYRVTVE